MEIEIKELKQDGKVVFITDCGGAIGKWEAESPKLKIYNVEINIEDELFWGDNILLNDISEEQISVTEMDKVILKGKLESVDDDNCAVLRIKNSIILFDAVGAPFPVGSMIKIFANNITLYPY